MRWNNATVARLFMAALGAALPVAAAVGQAAPMTAGVGPHPGESRSSALCAADANADGVVNFTDITSILSNWGSSVLPADSREALMGQRYISGDTAITILGDSTTNPNQGVTFVPDYYGILARRTGPICGFGIGTGAGGARPGGNQFIAVSGGGNLQYVGNVQNTTLAPSTPASSRTPMVPPGDHADWKVKRLSDGDDFDGDISSFGPTYRIDIRRLAGLFPARGDWLAGGRGRIRVPFLRHREAIPGCVGELNLQTFEDFDGDGVFSSALTNRNVFIAGSDTRLIPFDSDVGGIGITPSSRIRLEVRGRTPEGSGDYPGKTVIFGSPIVYNADAVGYGFYLDSLSVGGWSVLTHWIYTSRVQLAQWREVQPRPGQYLWIYLGQNDVLIDAAWETRFVELCERAEGAGFIPVMVVPPSVSDFSVGKAALMRDIFGRLRTERGWPVLDIDAKLGRKLGGPEMFDQIHRTMTGALVIADTIQAIMQEYADHQPEVIGDANADGAVDIQDITAVLSSWGAACP